MKRTDFLRGLGALVAAAVASPLLSQAVADGGRTASEEAEVRRLAVESVVRTVPWETNDEITRRTILALRDAECSGRVTAVSVGTNRPGTDVVVTVDFSEGPSIHAHWRCVEGQRLEPGCVGLCTTTVRSGSSQDWELCTNIYRSSR